MIKFLHFADLHLGVENYGRFDGKTGLHSRFNDYILSFQTCIDIALEEKVDLVLFCGDAYKNNNPSPTHQREFAKQISRLSSAGVPTVLINGNHDNPLTFGRASSIDIFQTLSIPHIYVVTEPCLLTVDTQMGPVQVLGIPWPTRNQYLEKEEYRDDNPQALNRKIQKRLMKTIEQFIGQLNPEIPKIMAAHLTVAEAVFSGSEAYAMIGNDPALNARFLSETPFDYIALGHIHKYQNLNLPEKLPVVYSGSMERIHFGEEKEEKGFCMGTIDSNGRSVYEFVPLPVRRMITIQVNIQDTDDPTERLLEEIRKYDLREAIVRIHYEISEENEKRIYFSQVDEQLREAYFVAGISRNVLKGKTRPRSSLTEELDVFEALDEYIQIQGWQKEKEDLKDYARTLSRELDRIDEKIEENKK